MDVVIPGELVHLPKPSTKLGPGTLIDKEKGQAYFCKAGIVKRGGNDSVWVHCLRKRVSIHQLIDILDFFYHRFLTLTVRCQ